MNPKIRIAVVVALTMFVLGGIATAAMKETRTRPHRAAAQPQSAQGDGPVVVYYFHGYQRCAGCLRTEKMMREVLDEAFSPEMRSGKLVFRAVNVEDIENIDIVERFSVTARHPVVADERHGPNGSWKEIQRIPGDRESLRRLLESIVRPMLQNGEGS